MVGEVEVPLVTLNSGWKMPLIGLGTATSTHHSKEQLISVFLDAIEAGYRHFDTAALYGTEQPLGLAVAEAVRRGLIKSREELFITSKLWCTDADRDLVLPALKKSLGNLGLEFLDLYLIHWPVRMKNREITLEADKVEFLPFDIKSTWEAMEACQRLGLVRSIGVSNYSCKKLSQLLAHATIPPAMNQVEMNPAWDQRKLREFCKGNGIHITAWSPLGANGVEAWGSLNVMESPVLKEIACARGSKSVAAVSLRWVYEQGVSMVVKSFNSKRMRDNLQIIDWELSDEERNKIRRIPQKRGASGDIFTSPNGPYKSVEELWDGEI